MAERVFIDTNIVIYACDRTASDKRIRARDALASLMRERRAVISTQVPQEFFAAATPQASHPARTRAEPHHLVRRRPLSCD